MSSMSSSASLTSRSRHKPAASAPQAVSTASKLEVSHPKSCKVKSSAESPNIFSSPKRRPHANATVQKQRSINNTLAPTQTSLELEHGLLCTMCTQMRYILYRGQMARIAQAHSSKEQLSRAWKLTSELQQEANTHELRDQRQITSSKLHKCLLDQRNSTAAAFDALIPALTELERLNAAIRIAGDVVPGQLNTNTLQQFTRNFSLAMPPHALKSIPETEQLFEIHDKIKSLRRAMDVFTSLAARTKRVHTDTEPA